MAVPLDSDPESLGAGETSRMVAGRAAGRKVGQSDESRCCSRQEGREREDFKLGERRKSEHSRCGAQPRRKRRGFQTGATAPVRPITCCLSPKITLHWRQPLPTKSFPIKSKTCQPWACASTWQSLAGVLASGGQARSPPPPPPIPKPSVHGVTSLRPRQCGPACAGGAEEGEEPRGRPTTVSAASRPGGLGPVSSPSVLSVAVRTMRGWGCMVCRAL